MMTIIGFCTSHWETAGLTHFGRDMAFVMVRHGVGGQCPIYIEAIRDERSYDQKRKEFQYVGRQVSIVELDF